MTCRTFDFGGILLSSRACLIWGAKKRFRQYAHARRALGESRARRRAPKGAKLKKI